MIRNCTFVALTLVVSGTIPASLAFAVQPRACKNGQCSTVPSYDPAAYNGCVAGQGCASGNCARGPLPCGYGYGACPPARHPCYLCCSANAAYRASLTNWHGNYYDVAWGTPVALVCPPNAGRQTKWAWGVTNTQVVPISHQFGRNYPGPYPAGGGAPGFLPTPIWPNSTDQFGVYYVRGPW